MSHTILEETRVCEGLLFKYMEYCERNKNMSLLIRDKRKNEESNREGDNM